MSNEGIVGRRVLVVEDDYLLAMDLAAMLHRAGAEVIGPVSNVGDALDALSETPDVAALDVQLGNETSVAIADELTRRDVPFIFVTGSREDVPATQSARIVCSKPVSDAAMLKALSDALESALP